MYKNHWLKRKAIREDAMIVYPEIYGFKTPEKHMFKFTDGDPDSKPACEKRWKRMEMLSSCGTSFIFKDDGQDCGTWSIPKEGIRFVTASGHTIEMIDEENHE